MHDFFMMVKLTFSSKITITYIKEFMEELGRFCFIAKRRLNPVINYVI